MTALALRHADTDRRKYITSTDIRAIAAGKIADLVKEKRGGPAPNLDHVFRVQLGKHTESFHAAWHCKTTDLSGEQVHALRLPDLKRMLPEWVAASYDYELSNGQVLELKHTNERNPFRECATYYMPQLQWQMLVTGDTSMRFSIIPGNGDPVWGEIAADPVMQELLLMKAENFREIVASGADVSDVEPDAAIAAAAKAVKIDGKRAYDYKLNNEWQAKSRQFIIARHLEKKSKEVIDQFKKLVPADASEVDGGMVSCKRDARGAIRWQVTEKEDELGELQADVMLAGLIPTEQG